MRALGVCAGTVVVLLLLSTLLGGAQEASAAEVVFREISPLQQERPASESITYEWFVYNNDDVTYLLELSRTPSSGTGWDSEFSQTIFVLGIGESVFVNLTVSASSEVTSKTIVQNVSFQFTDLSNLTVPATSITSSVSTKMIPTWGVVAPGKNKLLGRFDNPPQRTVIVKEKSKQ